MTCGVHRLIFMGQRLVERRLRETSARLRALKEELAIVEEQLAHLSDDADDKALRSLVSETPGSAVEYREASLHRDAMVRHRQSVEVSISELLIKQDQLLDKIGH
jgi:hypothetical protein